MDDFAPFEISPMGEDTIIIRFDERHSHDPTLIMLSLSSRIRDLYGDAILDIVPSYSSMVIHYDLLKVNLVEEVSSLRELIHFSIVGLDHEPDSVSRLIRIPVCYDSSFALDLFRMSQMLKMEESEIVKIHVSANYRVFAIGFTPGFPYLGDVPYAIACPRLETPRRTIPTGSVGIADMQTGIYPIESPGGWNIIGRTPLRLLDLNPEPSSPFRSGDRVQFVSIDKPEFERCEGMSVMDWDQIKP